MVARRYFSVEPSTCRKNKNKNTNRCGGKNPHNKLSIFVIFYATKYFTNFNAAIFDAIDVTVSSPRFLSLQSKQTHTEEKEKQNRKTIEFIFLRIN